MLFDNLDDYETAIDTRAWLDMPGYRIFWRALDDLVFAYGWRTHAGRARRKIASVPCPHCGGGSVSNGGGRRRCAECGRTFAA